MTSIASHRGYGAVPNRAQDFSQLPAAVDEGADEGLLLQGRTADRVGTNRSWRKLAFVALVIGAMAAATMASSRTNNQGEVPADTVDFVEFNNGLEEVEQGSVIQAAVAESGDSPASLPPLFFTALNYYHIRDGKPGKDYPWLKDAQLIEPHRETILSVSPARDGYDYRWEVRDGSGSGELHATARGKEAAVMLTKLNEHVITLEELDQEGQVIRSLEEKVYVKYVRREIRTLTDVERNELLDAMHQLWEVKMDEGGKEIYGEEYADIYVMNRLHHLGGSGYTCDHFHDGVGFLTSHTLLTNTFEHSLRLVNPKLSLPYWDFTIEESSSAPVYYNRTDPTSRTELLDAAWFGSLDLEDNMVKDGRWAFTEVQKVRDSDKYEEIRSDVYGKLRSPWNVNDRKYVTRGAGKMCGLNLQDACAWPTCEIHYDLVNNYNSFYDWSWESMYWPHGPVHFWLGGFMDCTETYHQVAEIIGSSEAAQLLVSKAFDHRKALYWAGIWYCDGNVSEDTTQAEVFASGVCGCQGYDLTQGDDYKTISGSIGLSRMAIGFDELDEDQQRGVVEHICSGKVSFGDHTQSSSSLDPMFWPMHPTMERLWQFSVLSGSVTDFKWADFDTVVGPDGSEETNKLSTYGDTCVGHRARDVFPFGLLDRDTSGFKIRTGIRGQESGGNTMTNREILAALDPRIGTATHYIYDNFKWDHCAIDGYDFDDTWEKLTKRSQGSN